MHLSFVHEFQEGGHVWGRRTVQDHQKVLVKGGGLEEVGQMFTARRQYKFVGFECDTWKILICLFNHKYVKM